MAGSALFTTCVLLFVGAGFQFTSGQDAGERPGVCPPIEFMSLETCTSLCTGDAECPAGRKCCKTGCNGRSCKVPNEKPGVCPVVKPVYQEPCPRVRSCISDSTCAEFLKCCPSSCGRHYCRSPEGKTEA